MNQRLGSASHQTPVLDALTAILGSDRVTSDPQRLASWSSTTIPTTSRISIIAEPETTREIQQIVRLAARANIHVYPVSTGKNWGYGTASPVTDGNIVLALHRMNRILEVNEEFAYAVVEPGVTQRQLSEHLRQQNFRLWIDAWGSSPECSLVGNALERGFGVGPYGDHFDSTCGLEVVLGDGEILRTGFGHHPVSQSTYVFQGGVGPDLRPLFCQSSFGIVTRMGLWLLPEPKHFEACYFVCDTAEQAPDFFDALRRLKLNNVIRGGVQLSHKNRVMSMMTRYPWQEYGGKAVPSSYADSVLARKRLGLWNGSMGLYGEKPEVAAAKRIVKRELRGIASKLTFVSSRRLRLLGRHGTLLQRFFPFPVAEVLNPLRASFDLMTGVPNAYALPAAYWRNRTTECPLEEPDPARDGCGLIFHSAVVPFAPECIDETVSCAESVMRDHDLEAFPTITTIGSRSAIIMLPILFDKSEPAQCGRAMECHQKLSQALAARGYHSYRYGIQSMRDQVDAEDPFWKVVGKIKTALDPSNVVAPHRYCP